MRSWAEVVLKVKTNFSAQRRSCSPAMSATLLAVKALVLQARIHSYKSVITGTMAPVHHTPWKDALDDSLEVYLQN